MSLVTQNQPVQGQPVLDHSVQSSTVQGHLVSNNTQTRIMKGIILLGEDCLRFQPESQDLKYKIDILTKVNPNLDLSSSPYVLRIGVHLILFNKEGELDSLSQKNIISYGKKNAIKCETNVKNIW